MDSPQATGRPTARRPALWVAGLGIAVLVGTAFALSFEGVHALARAGGVRDPLAYLYPLVLDGFLLVALAGAVVLRSARVWIVWYPWALILILLGAAAAANAARSLGLIGDVPAMWTSLTVAVAPLAALALAFPLWLSMFVRARSGRRHTVAARPNTATDTVPGPDENATAVGERAGRAGSPGHAGTAETPRSSGPEPSDRQASATEARPLPQRKRRSRRERVEAQTEHVRAAGHVAPVRQVPAEQGEQAADEGMGTVGDEEVSTAGHAVPGDTPLGTEAAEEGEGAGSDEAREPAASRETETPAEAVDTGEDGAMAAAGAGHTTAPGNGGGDPGLEAPVPATSRETDQEPARETTGTPRAALPPAAPPSGSVRSSPTPPEE